MNGGKQALDTDVQSQHHHSMNSCIDELITPQKYDVDSLSVLESLFN